MSFEHRWGFGLLLPRVPVRAVMATGKHPTGQSRNRDGNHLDCYSVQGLDGRAPPSYVRLQRIDERLVIVTPSPGSAGPTIFNCTPTLCTGQVVAPIGNDTFVVQVWNGLGATGEVLSSGTTQWTVVPGTNDVPALTLNLSSMRLC